MSNKVKLCTYCGCCFEAKPRTPQKYCSPICRKKKNQHNDNIASKVWHDKNPISATLQTLKQRSDKAGLLFDLSVEDIIIPTHCPVLGIKIERQQGNGGKFNSPSVDRIDNTLGYVKGNIMVMSRLANSMKSNATNEELIIFAQWVMGRMGKCDE